MAQVKFQVEFTDVPHPESSERTVQARYGGLSVDLEVNKELYEEGKLTMSEVLAHTIISVLNDNEMMGELMQKYLPSIKTASLEEEADVSGTKEQPSTVA